MCHLFCKAAMYLLTVLEYVLLCMKRKKIFVFIDVVCNAAAVVQGIDSFDFHLRKNKRDRILNNVL